MGNVQAKYGLRTRWEASVERASGGGGLRVTDYPGLFQSADRASIKGQTSYLRSLKARLLLGVLAAAAAAFTVRVGPAGTDIAALLTALAFVGSMVIHVAIATSRSGAAWYKGRALAESVKTLTWRYAVGGAPFPVRAVTPAAEADRLFVKRMEDLQRDLPEVSAAATTAGAISERMRELRGAPLDDRKRVYLDDRILAQQQWYSAKARHHSTRAAVYRSLSLILEVTGVIAALSKAIGLVSFDLAGIVAASIAGIAAWGAARQHTATTHAYAVATHELSVIFELLQYRHNERDWAAAVADAEAAISREHTTWRASHGLA
ncbi:DUF4231 domain-containing protein [Flindersiella endophytica]